MIYNATFAIRKHTRGANGMELGAEPIGDDVSINICWTGDIASRGRLFFDVRRVRWAGSNLAEVSESSDCDFSIERYRVVFGVDGWVNGGVGGRDMDSSTGKQMLR